MCIAVQGIVGSGHTACVGDNLLHVQAVAVVLVFYFQFGLNGVDRGRGGHGSVCVRVHCQHTAASRDGAIVKLGPR